MTLANDSMAWAGRYPGRHHNNVLNKVSFVLHIELTERVVKQALSRHHCISHNLVLHTKINCCTIGLIYPTLQGVELIFDRGLDLNFKKWTSVGVSSILTRGLTWISDWCLATRSGNTTP
ncbi:hypothetical protein IWW34DRAFT_634105 [Fusarium oxysporum f. sp. albedinis]|nr:hypothetical protein IWW34DRAFT_634105 [Fusarium oxysporum f. sp. albedinis]